MRLRTLLATLRRREFIVHWGIAFTSAIGALSAVVALLPAVKFNVSRSVAILLICALFGVIFAFLKTRQVHLPVEDLAPPSLNPGPHMTVEVNCGRSLIAQAQDLASGIYGDVPAIPRERYQQWLHANCNILACLVDESRRVVGYFDVLPLRTQLAESFICGTVEEREISAVDILSPETSKSARYLYLAGFAVSEPGTRAGGRRASYLMWALKRYLEHFYDSSGKTQLLATAATPEGEHILQRYNFQLIECGSVRRDGFAIYSVSLSRRLLEAMAAPDWSRACRLSWDEPHRRKRMSA